MNSGKNPTKWESQLDEVWDSLWKVGRIFFNGKRILTAFIVLFIFVVATIFGEFIKKHVPSGWLEWGSGAVAKVAPPASLTAPAPASAPKIHLPKPSPSPAPASAPRPQHYPVTVSESKSLNIKPLSDTAADHPTIQAIQPDTTPKASAGPKTNAKSAPRINQILYRLPNGYILSLGAMEPIFRSGIISSFGATRISAEDAEGPRINISSAFTIATPLEDKCVRIYAVLNFQIYSINHTEVASDTLHSAIRCLNHLPDRDSGDTATVTDAVHDLLGRLPNY